MKSLLDKSFEYVNAAETSKPGYLAAKFAKIRREMAQRQRAELATPEPDPTVLRFELPAKVRK